MRYALSLPLLLLASALSSGVLSGRGGARAEPYLFPARITGAPAGVHWDGAWVPTSRVLSVERLVWTQQAQSGVSGSVWVDILGAGEVVLCSLEIPCSDPVGSHVATGEEGAPECTVELPSESHWNAQVRMGGACPPVGTLQLIGHLY